MVKAPTPKFVPTDNFYPGGNLPIRFIVIHATVSPCKCGGAADIAHYFQRAGTSAHYVVDPCTVRQCVHDWDRAWHCGSPGNDHSIGVEHCSYVPPHGSWHDPDHEEMLERSAKLVARLCEAYGIPKRRISARQLARGASGICGHDDVTKGLGGTTHTDPGGGFPWRWYMRRVRGITPMEEDIMASKDELRQIIREELPQMTPFGAYERLGWGRTGPDHRIGSDYDWALLHIRAEQKAQSRILEKLAGKVGIDAAEVRQAIEHAVKDEFDGYELQLHKNEK